MKCDRADSNFVIGICFSWRHSCYAQFNGCALGSRERTSSDRPGLTENAAQIALLFTFAHILTNGLGLRNPYKLL